MTEDAAERAKRYVAILEGALSTAQVLGEVKAPSVEDLNSILDMARRYLEDAKYYLRAGRPVTSLASASYAEGLLDAVARLKLAKVEWGR